MKNVKAIRPNPPKGDDRRMDLIVIIEKQCTAAL